MARINTTQLVENATHLGRLTDRVHQVQRDPAVQKAWTEFGGDVAKAFSSGSTLAVETRAAWRRTAPRGGELAGLDA